MTREIKDFAHREELARTKNSLQECSFSLPSLARNESDEVSLVKNVNHVSAVKLARR